MKIQVYQEECCELCMQVIHNHIDCPVCNAQYASTSLYQDIHDEDVDGFICEECNTEFKILSKEGYIGDWEYEIV